MVFADLRECYAHSYHTYKNRTAEKMSLNTSSAIISWYNAGSEMMHVMDKSKVYCDELN